MLLKLENLLSQRRKNMLQQIYDHAGFSGKTAKATDLGKYLCSQKVQRTDGQGNRLWYIEILG